MENVKRIQSMMILGNIYHGSSAATSGWLKILAAPYLLLVGSGSPAGVYTSQMTYRFLLKSEHFDPQNSIQFDELRKNCLLYYKPII